MRPRALCQAASTDVNNQRALRILPSPCTLLFPSRSFYYRCSTVFSPKIQKQESRVAALQEEVDRLQEELGQASSAGEDADKIVKAHIKLLHRYNEAKDAAQVLSPILAVLKETTVREIHKDLDLPDGE
ncbi:Swi5-domain-containing protein [Mycena floridula]|nr:Swi5-domain-containing protein [Mycena floridula]